MPEFQKAFEDKGGDVLFMMVNMTDGSRETAESAGEFIKEQGYTFPVYYDTEQSAAYAYGINAIPMTVFIDSDGYAVYTARGSSKRMRC